MIPSLQNLFMMSLIMQNHSNFFNIRTESTETLDKWSIWSKFPWNWVYQVRAKLG